MANLTGKNTFFSGLCLHVLVLGLLASGQSTAAQNTRQQPTVRQRLVNGLQVRRPVEAQYIDAVIDTVNRGELPQKLVDRVFFWARTRPSRSGRTQRPIIYFQAGLDRISKKMRITIEADRPAPPSSGG